MNFVKIAWRDISNTFRNRFIRIMVIATIILPMLYSLCFLGAFWDPYGKLSKLPVAIVNLDKGGTDNNKSVNYGKDFVKKMKKNKEMGWHFVSYDEAQKGINGKKYYAEFILPSNFTSSILKAKTSKPIPPVIKFRCNEKKNFIIGQLTGKSLPTKIQDAISRNITETSVKIAFDNLYEIKDAMKKAGKGSKTISDAVSEANNKLKDAKAELDNNSDLTSLITKENFNLLKSTINDAESLKDTDTSTLSQITDLLTPSNVSSLRVINNDLKAANIEKLTNSPLLKNLPKLASTQNLQNVNALMKDTDTLSKIDMVKMKPLLNLMNKQDQISSLINDTKKLTSNIDKKKIEPLINVAKNKTQLLDLVNSANTLSGKVDTTKLLPLVSLMQNSDKLFGLMNDADKLSSAASAKELEPLLNLAKNTDKFTPVLQDALKLSSIDVSSIQNSLAQQLKNSQAFVTGTSFLPQSKDSLKASVMSNAALTTEQKTQLITIIEASSLARDNMVSSAKDMTSISQNLDTLKSAQTNISSIVPLVKDIPTSIQYVNTQVMPQLTKVQQELTDSKALLTNVPDSITYIKGLTPQLLSMYTKLQTVKPLMTGVPESLNYVNGLTPQALSIYNKAMQLKPLTNGLEQSLNYVKTLAPKLIAMKADLDKNASNLQAVKQLLAKANDPETKASLDKIVKLQKDVASIKPMLNSLQSQMTDENISKLNDVPALANKLISMQQKLKDNENLLTITQNALTDHNYDEAKKLIDAMPDLVSGVQKLADGTKELSTKLNDGYDTLNHNLVNSSSTMGKFLSEPVKIKNNPINSVPNYGSGFAPYFIPLSLWIGALLMFFVMSTTVDDDINAGPVGTVVGKYLSFGYIGIIQAVTVTFGVMLLGLKPTSLPILILFNIFLSYAFISIVQSFMFLTGPNVGKFLALVLLILQLASSGGTFPTELIPRIFGIIHPFLPFTYATEGLREIISAQPINYALLSKDVCVLAGMLIGFLALSIVMKNHADALQSKIEAKKAEADAAMRSTYNN